MALVFLIGMSLHVTVVFRLNKCPAQNEMRGKAAQLFLERILYQENKIGRETRYINKILPSQMTKPGSTEIQNTVFKDHIITVARNFETTEHVELLSLMVFSYSFCENVEKFLHTDNITPISPRLEFILCITIQRRGQVKYFE